MCNKGIASTYLINKKQRSIGTQRVYPLKIKLLFHRFLCLAPLFLSFNSNLYNCYVVIADILKGCFDRWKPQKPVRGKARKYGGKLSQNLTKKLRSL